MYLHVQVYRQTHTTFLEVWIYSTHVASYWLINKDITVIGYMLLIYKLCVECVTVNHILLMNIVTIQKTTPIPGKKLWINYIKCLTNENKMTMTQPKWFTQENEIKWEGKWKRKQKKIYEIKWEDIIRHK